MLMIELYNASAVWDDDDAEWVARDKQVAFLLNETIPEDIRHVHIPFLPGGKQSYALAAAQKQFGAKIKILKETELETPPETPGAED